MTPPRTAAPTRASIGSQATAKPVAWRYPIRGGRYATTTNEDDARRASTDGTVDALCVIGNNGLTKQQALEVIEQIAGEWDACEFEAPGGSIDIGDAIRRAGFAKVNAAAGVLVASTISEEHCRKITRALRTVQEMWDELERRKLNPILMREYSDAISVLENDLKARLPTDESGVRLDAQALGRLLEALLPFERLHVAHARGQTPDVTISASVAVAHTRAAHEAANELRKALKTGEKGNGNG
ncbi:MAG: hypothetical protein K0Q43_230 [Ramlibacter sp.]|jgi:hypothetical protein|nr:hypothetical protein [Ramlibacter sp.]